MMYLNGYDFLVEPQLRNIENANQKQTNMRLFKLIKDLIGRVLAPFSIFQIPKIEI